MQESILLSFKQGHRSDLHINWLTGSPRHASCHSVGRVWKAPKSPLLQLQGRPARRHVLLQADPHHLAAAGKAHPSKSTREAEGTKAEKGKEESLTGTDFQGQRLEPKNRTEL